MSKVSLILKVTPEQYSSPLKDKENESQGKMLTGSAIPWWIQAPSLTEIT